jgi:hypothetical protein
MAKLDFDDSQALGQTPINSWASLRELELNVATSNMLPQIKNLRSLKINKIRGIDDNDLHKFCLNNRELEQLDLNYEGLPFSQFEVIAEHLSNLKVLILKTIWLGCDAHQINGSGNR